MLVWRGIFRQIHGLASELTLGDIMSGFSGPLTYVTITNSDPNTTPNLTSIYENANTGNYYNVSSPTSEIFQYISVSNASPQEQVTISVTSGTLTYPGSLTGATSYTTLVGDLSANVSGLVFVPDPGSTSTKVTISVPSSGLPNVGGWTDTYYVYCFAEGTMIACPEGERPVESLLPGEMVLNAAGVARPVRFIGRRELSFAERSEHAPVRLPAGCLADGVPSRDLRVSPDHAIAIDGVLVTARALIGDAIKQEDVDSVVYYHIQLDGHDVVIADGAPCETLLDADDPVGFDNAADAPITDVFLAPCLPRVSQGETVEAIRARIRARALVGA